MNTFHTIIYLIFGNYISASVWIYLGVRYTISVYKNIDYKEENFRAAFSFIEDFATSVGMTILGMVLIFMLIKEDFFYTRFKIVYQESELDKYPEKVTLKRNDSTKVDAKFIQHSNTNS